MQDYLRTILFQFQLGTIGTSSIKLFLLVHLISIPVRYDWNFMEYKQRVNVASFQFQLGTIGTVGSASYVKTSSIFQFQLGTIGTHDLNASFHLSAIFQFQLGTIGTQSLVALRQRSAIFQFQLGTIGTFLPIVRQQGIIISIPVRYDWNASCNAELNIFWPYFNSS